MQLEMYRGDTPAWDLVVTLDGVPFNLTGATLYFTAKQGLSDADPGLFQLTNGAGITVTSAADGEATIRPRRADTSSLTSDVQAFWDVQLSIAGSAEAYTIASGTLLIRRDVTRAA